MAPSLDFTDQYYNSGDGKGDDQIQNGGQAAFLGLVYVFLWIKIDTLSPLSLAAHFTSKKNRRQYRISCNNSIIKSSYIKKWRTIRSSV